MFTSYTFLERLAKTAMRRSTIALLAVATIAVPAAIVSLLPQRGGDTWLPPLEPTIAGPSSALTFARVRVNERVVTLLVTEETKEGVRAIDLSARSGLYDADPFDLVAAIGRDRLVAIASASTDTQLYPVDSLLPSGPDGTSHIAVGINYSEHGREVGLDTVFLFPKFAPAGAAVTTVQAIPGMLLDYEVEICARFDRNLASIEDFDDAAKGFFLCGDFTDRAALLRGVDRDNIESGLGFSDAKSGRDFFPTGPYLVVPADWRAFVNAEPITTSVNDEARQQGRGGEMIKDLRLIVTDVLAEGAAERWRFGGRPVPLAAGGIVRRDAAILTGTPPGVVFRSPDWTDIARGLPSYLFDGFWTGSGVSDWIVERFIDRQQRAGIYLQPGDIVIHRSQHMGEIRIAVQSPPA